MSAPGQLKRAALAACLAALFGLTACTAPVEPERISGPLAEDPLTAVTPGPLLFDPPSESRVASFGAIVLCSTRPGADIQLDRVRYDFSVAPVQATPWMRSVPVVEDRTEGRDFDWRPLTVTQGYPPSTFKQGPYLGTFTKDLEDYGIVQLCAGVANLAAPRQELITAVKAEAEGVALDRVMVDYHVGATDYTLSIPVDAQVCGTEVC